MAGQNPTVTMRRTSSSKSHSISHLAYSMTMSSPVPGFFQRFTTQGYTSLPVRTDRRRFEARAILKVVLILAIAVVLLGLGSWHLPKLAESRQRMQFLYVIPTPTEGIGSMAILARRCGYLALQAGGKMSLPEYYTVTHHYSISDALPNAPLISGSYDGNLCLLSEYITHEEFERVTQYNGTINGPLDAVVSSLKKKDCSVVVCDLQGDNNHGGMDILTALYGRYSDCSPVPGEETINIHIRWGDAAASTNAASYGREKSADVAAARRYIDAARARGIRTRVQIYTQKDDAGDLPPLPELNGIEHSFVLEGDVRTTLHGLGDCDALFTGGSQMAILASAIACAPIIVFPDSQLSYFEDSREMGVRYVAASSIVDPL